MAWSMLRICATSGTEPSPWRRKACMCKAAYCRNQKIIIQDRGGAASGILMSEGVGAAVENLLGRASASQGRGKGGVEIKRWSFGVVSATQKNAQAPASARPPRAAAGLAWINGWRGCTRSRHDGGEPLGWPENGLEDRTCMGSSLWQTAYQGETSSI